MRYGIIIYIFFIGLSSSVSAQTSFRLKGKVLDDSSGIPVAGAFIVCQNTTIGASTEADGTFSLSLPSGGHDIIIGSTGYENETRRISANAGASENIEVRIKKKVKQMEDVVVLASSEVADGWEKYGQHFRDYFLGKTPFAESCIIENPSVLKFYYLRKKKQLKVKADSAIVIQNNALGYRINYLIDSFFYDYQTDFSLYSGVTFYSELEGTEQDKVVWKKNREVAYWGSRLHFIRAYYDAALAENGFLLEKINANDSTYLTEEIKNPYDPEIYQRVDSFETHVFITGKLRLTYLDAPMHQQYLEAKNYPLLSEGQVSTIDISNSFIMMDNGYYYEQRDFISSGYWAWKNIADKLPYDYWPDND